MAVRAGLYMRISDDPDDLGEGVTRQREDCEDVAAERAWEGAGYYTDNDSSAYNRKKIRPEYERLINDFLAGVLDAIVVWDVDGFTRQTYELELLLRAVEEKGGRRIADASGEYDLSNGDHQDILRHKVIAAQKESRDKSRRVKRANLQRARRGLPTHSQATKKRPFGYNYDHVTIVPKEAGLIKDAAQGLLEGSVTLSGLVRQWEAAGVKTTFGNSMWAYQSLKGILVSPRIAGLVEYQGEILKDRRGNYVRGQWEPILDQETFFALQRKLTDPARRTNMIQKEGRRYLLTGGLGYCGKCGARLGARPRQKPNEEGYRSYGCARKRNCGIRQAAEPLEAFIKDVIRAAIDHGALDRVLAQMTGQEAKERELLDTLRAKEDKLLELDDLFFDGDIPKDRYLRQKQRLESAITDLRNKLSSNGHGKMVAGMPRGADALRKAWDTRGLKWQRAVTQLLIEKVIVHPDPKVGQNGFDPSRVEVVWRA
jgi:site-specific DNA recombinase